MQLLENILVSIAEKIIDKIVWFNKEIVVEIFIKNAKAPPDNGLSWGHDCFRDVVVIACLTVFGFLLAGKVCFEMGCT